MLTKNTIYYDNCCKCVLLELLKGDILKEHKTSFDIIIIMKSGELNISFYEQSKNLSDGDLLCLKANTPHSVTAIVDCSFYLFKITKYE